MVGIAFERKRLISEVERCFFFFLPDWYNSTTPAKPSYR